MTEATDYYVLLGVPEGAGPEVIKRAYRALAREWHPDCNPGDAAAEERFKQVQAAYQVLSDPGLRRAYDRARRRQAWAQDVHVRAGHASPFRGADGLDPLAAFFFGDDGPAVSLDVETQVRLTFDQALRGGRTEIQSGAGGPVPLTIPQGVRSGLKVRLPDRGRAGPDGRRGDLYVTFRVDPSPRFRREGDNLHVVETVSALEAIVGTTRQITNAYGQTVKVHIPPGTQPGERLRLRGQGVATRKRTGDLFVEVHVTVPRQLSDAQRRALEQTARSLGLL
jgi:DnaJ-class molecular chaperone